MSRPKLPNYRQATMQIAWRGFLAAGYFAESPFADYHQSPFRRDVPDLYDVQ